MAGDFMPAPEPMIHGDYRITLRQLDDDDWYWDLYFKDERINGGLGESYQAAKTAADCAKYGHNAQQWRSMHYWDQESYQWIEMPATGN